ncbi:MAG TPA: HD domain-containing phosphohydrolase [Burkholderiaceae bacterium]|jgi:response regulator RpfG family c-di-GMP phosphodiesterase|nr:HD domain-containing phosphohydrolase [Burkholderiaceae bacterium]
MEDSQVIDAPLTAADAPPFTLLCVDDEPNILSALKRLFRPCGWRVLSADGGVQALQLLEHEAVDVIISDMRMPGMDGAQLLERVAARWPQVVRLLLTGHADVGAISAAVNRGQIWRYVNKPWDDNELLLAVRQAVERRELERETMRLEALTRAQNEELRELNLGLEQRVQERTAEVLQAHERLKKNYLASIKAFSNVIELRGVHTDGHLVGHSRRVADTARRIAQTMARPEGEVQEIFIAGLLHDVGQVGLPDALLAKPVPRMSPEELALYSKHPILGEQMLMALDDMQPVATLLRAHHERWDGKGFPDRRAGTDIPLGARILAVADTFDDLQSGHIVASPLSSAEARAVMARGRGTQFDPEVLETFLHITEPQGQAKAAQRALAPPRAVLTGQLEPGMVLARDLVSAEGVVLLAADHVLTADLIQRICGYERREGLQLLLHVRAAKR